MKRKFISIFIALVLVLTLGLVTAVPVAAEVPAILLSSTGEIGYSNADTIIVEVPAGTTLGQIDSIAWSEYLIQGYPPHVDIMLDLNKDGAYDEALVFEYAYNTMTHYAAAPMPYGAVTGDWYQTFSDDGEGPAVVDDNAYAWLATRASGPPGAADHIAGSLADWKAGTVDPSVDSSAIVVQLEIEVDNYITDCEALVKDIVLGISGEEGLVDMTASTPGEIIGVSVDPTSVVFGSIVPGFDSGTPKIVTVTNEGNVSVNLDATIENESHANFYTDNLAIEGGAVSAWSGQLLYLDPDPLAPATFLLAELVLTMPSGAAAGDYTATLVFWVIAK